MKSSLHSPPIARSRWYRTRKRRSSSRLETNVLDFEGAVQHQGAVQYQSAVRYQNAVRARSDCMLRRKPDDFPRRHLRTPSESTVPINATPRKAPRIRDLPKIVATTATQISRINAPRRI